MEIPVAVVVAVAESWVALATLATAESWVDHATVEIPVAAVVAEIWADVAEFWVQDTLADRMGWARAIADAVIVDATADVVFSAADDWVPAAELHWQVAFKDAGVAVVESAVACVPDVVASDVAEPEISDRCSAILTAVILTRQRSIHTQHLVVEQQRIHTLITPLEVLATS